MIEKPISLDVKTQKRMIDDWFALMPSVPEAEPILGRMKLIRTELEKLDEIQANPDPMKSKLAIDLAIEKQRALLNDAYTKGKVFIEDQLEAYRVRLTNERLEKSKIKADAFASEIRLAFRALDKKEKYQFMSDTIKAGDGAAIAALCVEIPPLLCGLTAKEQQTFLDSFTSHWVGQNTQDWDTLHEVAHAFLSYVRPKCLPTGPSVVPVAA